MTPTARPPEPANPHRRFWLGRAGAVLGAFGTGAGLAWGLQSSPTADPVPPEVWAQRFQRPEGGELTLQSWQGKTLLLNFWATWCPPCVEELPLLHRFAQAQAAAGGSGVQVVGLAVDQPSAVRAFLQRTPLGFPIGLAGLQGSALGKQLGNSGGLPFSVLINGRGQIVQRKIGRLSPDLLASWAQLR